MDDGLPVVHLKPAEWCICKEPTKISTILGSCVSVTMFNQRLSIGAICHALLPECKYKGGRCDGCHEKGRYVTCIIPEMLHHFRLMCVKPFEIKAKLFGGSGMLNNIITHGNRTVGGNNIEAALQTLGAEGLKIINSSTGGTYGRKLFFFSHTGEVLLKHLRKPK